MRFSISTSSRRIYYITSKVYFIFLNPRLNEFSEYRDCGTFGRIGRSTHTIRNKRVANRRLIKKKFHNPGFLLRGQIRLFHTNAPQLWLYRHFNAISSTIPACTCEQVCLGASLSGIRHLRYLRHSLITVLQVLLGGVTISPFLSSK